MLAIQGARGRQAGAARDSLHPQFSPDGIWQHQDPIFEDEHWPFHSQDWPAQAGCGGMGHIERTNSTLFLLLHPEGRGKGGISISAKLGQVLQHWLADLTVEKQREIQKNVGKPQYYVERIPKFLNSSFSPSNNLVKFHIQPQVSEVSEERSSVLPQPKQSHN